MGVHEIVNCVTLDVVLHSVHQVAHSHVKDLDVGQVAGLVQSKSKVGFLFITLHFFL